MLLGYSTKRSPKVWDFYVSFSKKIRLKQILEIKGFSRSNLNYMRLAYRAFPICEELPHKLSWTHLCELVKIEDPLERSFYKQQAILENWSTTELKRQKKASLYLRLAASKDKEGIMQLAKQGQSVSKPEHIIRDPYVLDFLNIPELHQYSETELEGRIIEHLQHFLLELLCTDLHNSSSKNCCKFSISADSICFSDAPMGWGMFKNSKT